MGRGLRGADLLGHVAPARRGAAVVSIRAQRLLAALIPGPAVVGFDAAHAYLGPEG